MIYKGFLNIDEYGCLECGDSYLISDVASDFKRGDKVLLFLIPLLILGTMLSLIATL
jgi:hypothetical protein